MRTPSYPFCRRSKLRSLSARHAALVLLVCILLVSCTGRLRSPGVTITTVNNTFGAVNTIEIDYPGGSYGIGSLPAGGSHARWIKVTGNAPLRIVFVDSQGEHQLKPVVLRADDSGAIVLHIQNNGQVSVEDQRKR